MLALGGKRPCVRCYLQLINLVFSRLTEYRALDLEIVTLAENDLSKITMWIAYSSLNLYTSLEEMLLQEHNVSRFSYSSLDTDSAFVIASVSYSYPLDSIRGRLLTMRSGYIFFRRNATGL